MCTIEQLTLVNYSHPDCTPLLNIMRLPKTDAFLLAKKMADAHPETTAFYRFADFENYYALREAQDAYLHARFIELGGKPEEEHPLSFVLEGSAYLRAWFGNGTETRLPLREIDPAHISFTVGDSGADYQKNGRVALLTLEDLRRKLEPFESFEAFMAAASRNYVEVQLWSDRYLDRCAINIKV